MSNRGGGKKRPTKLVNLSGDEDGSSSPVNIPPSKSRQRQNYTGIHSAPGERRRPFYGSSLVEPVIDEGEVMISGSLKSDTSTMDRRNEAARGGLGEYRSLQIQHYGATDGEDGPLFGGDDGTPEGEQSTEIAEDYVKIAQRHKREDHGTTYEYL